MKKHLQKLHQVVGTFPSKHIWFLFFWGGEVDREKASDSLFSTTSPLAFRGFSCSWGDIICAHHQHSPWAPSSGLFEASIVHFALTPAARRTGGVNIPRATLNHWGGWKVSGLSLWFFRGTILEDILHHSLESPQQQGAPDVHNNNQWMHTAFTGFFLLLPHSLSPTSRDPSPKGNLHPRPKPLLRVCLGENLN